MKKIASLIFALFAASLVFAAPVKRTEDTKDLAENWNENDI